MLPVTTVLLSLFTFLFLFHCSLVFHPPLVFPHTLTASFPLHLHSGLIHSSPFSSPLQSSLLLPPLLFRFPPPLLSTMSPFFLIYGLILSSTSSSPHSRAAVVPALLLRSELLVQQVVQGVLTLRIPYFSVMDKLSISPRFATGRTGRGDVTVAIVCKHSYRQP